MYKSPGWVAPTYSAQDTIEPNFGRLDDAREPESGLCRGARRRRASAVALARCSSSLFAIAAGLLTVALLQLRRQQELARLRTEFVSGVSHELRTPLAQIRWFAELLHMGKLRTEDERARSAGIIDQEARRLTYLVENVLNFSRGEKGANRISPSPATTWTAKSARRSSCSRRSRARGVSTIVSALTARAVVPFDRDALRQILLNLLDNAVKYGPPGQTITVGSGAGGRSGANLGRR